MFDSRFLHGAGVRAPEIPVPAASGAVPAALANCTLGRAAGFGLGRAPHDPAGDRPHGRRAASSVGMATDRAGIPGYGAKGAERGSGAVVKHTILLLAVAFGAPALLDATLGSPEAAAIPELAPWVMMLLGFAGTAVTVRAHTIRRRAASKSGARATP